MADGAGKGLPAVARGLSMGPEAEARKLVLYSEALGQAIVARVAAGETLASVCRSPGMPHRLTATKWRQRYPEFGAAMAEAALKARTARRLLEREAAARWVARPKRRSGRRGMYSLELAETICERLTDGESLLAICRSPGMPAMPTVFRWVRQHPEFEAMYVVARQEQADYLLDEAREVALGATPKTVWADRLRFDTIRWMTARLAPKKYCEPVVLARAAAEIRAEAAEGADDRRLTVHVVRFERAPNGEVLAAPPRTPVEEAAWARAFGAPYDGPR